MQIKTTMIYNYISTRVAKTKRTWQCKCQQRQLEHFWFDGRSTDGTTTTENALAVFTRLNVSLSRNQQFHSSVFTEEQLQHIATKKKKKNDRYENVHNSLKKRDRYANNLHAHQQVRYKLWYDHTVEGYSSLKRNKWLIHTSTRMKTKLHWTKKADVKENILYGFTYIKSRNRKAKLQWSKSDQWLPLGAGDCLEGSTSKGTWGFWKCFVSSFGWWFHECI